MTSSHQAVPPSEGIDDDALDWFVRRTGGGFGARDEAAFQAWLAADAAHRHAYARQQDEWTALDRLPADGLGILRANLSADLAAEAARRSGPASLPRRRLLVPAFSVAAVAALAGGAGLVGWNHWQSQPVFAQDFGTPRGEQREVRLPDDSRLRLDTATRVQVRYYRQRREVILSAGQVVFGVQGDPSCPFDVLAGPLRITVVGTRFSVRHTPGLAGDDGVRVAVEEGRVRVRRAAADASSMASEGELYLGAGQQTVADAQGVLAPVFAVSTAGIAPWRDNRASFDNVRLDQVLAELERYGDTRLVIRDATVASLRITGTFNPARPDSFIRVLPQAAPVRLREAGGVLEIVRR